MTKKLARKTKALAVATSALLFGAAFMPGSCSLNIDQALLEQLAGLFGDFNGEFSFNGGPGNHDGPHDGFDDHHPGPGGGFDDPNGFDGNDPQDSNANE